MLPQVLAGLGMVSALSVGCLFWLQRLQSVFVGVAVGALVYEGWQVLRRPPARRTWEMKAIFATSLVVNLLLVGGWIVVWFRYR